METPRALHDMTLSVTYASLSSRSRLIRLSSRTFHVSYSSSSFSSSVLIARQASCSFLASSISFRMSSFTIWGQRTILLECLRKSYILLQARPLSGLTPGRDTGQYSSPPLIGTPFKPNNSVLITQVSFGEREEQRHP